MFRVTEGSNGLRLSSGLGLEAATCETRHLIRLIADAEGNITLTLTPPAPHKLFRMGLVHILLDVITSAFVNWGVLCDKSVINIASLLSVISLLFI